MATIPFALSVHHFISTVGADAGFAAIIGLAILILLYFSQARETASLRAWAADSAEHVQQLELRVAQLSRAQAAPPSPPSGSYGTPAPPPPGIARPGGAPAAQPAWAGAGSPAASRAITPAPVGVGAPAAPAGVGAPALSAATRLIPSSDRDQISIRAGSGSAIATEPRPVQDAGAMALAAPAPPPATAAGGANGTAPPRPAAPAAPAGSGPSRPTRRPVAAPARGGSRPAGRSRAGLVLIVLLGLLALAAVVVILLVVVSGGASSSSPSRSVPTAGAKSGRHGARGAAALTASSVTVAVLNGTSTANLAHSVSSRLGAAGFKPGTPGNASDHTQTTTVVGYLPHHRPAALLVAQSLKLGSASVQPVSSSNQTVACPASSTPCTVQVVVTVGSDLASKP